MQDLGNSTKIQSWTGKFMRSINSSSSGESSLFLRTSNKKYNTSDIYRSETTDTPEIERDTDEMPALFAGEPSLGEPEESEPSQIDVNDVAERVYKMMKKDLTREKERYGK